MSTTSWQVKKRYNDKTYKRYACDLKIASFEEIEKLRSQTGLSRSEFLQMLVRSKYPDSTV